MEGGLSSLQGNQLLISLFLLQDFYLDLITNLSFETFPSISLALTSNHFWVTSL